jgi:CubicO group peptidase (beta-lactamase class C family)
MANGSSTDAAIHLGWCQGSGGIYSTLADMTIFLQFLSNPDAFPAVGLSSVSIRQWFNPSMNLPDGKSAFGMPWEIDYTPDVFAWRLGKSGAIGTFSAQLYFLKEYQADVLSLSNIPNLAPTLASMS